MEVYGRTGYAIADRNTLLISTAQDQPLTPRPAPPLEKPYNDPFVYLAAVVRKEIEVKPGDLSSLSNNMIVVEILEAAKKSAKTGKVVKLKRK